MHFRFLSIAAIFCALATAQDARLRGGNILSCETYSYRELIRSGKLDMLGVPAFYKEQGIKGISYNDMFFKTRDDAYIDQVKEAVRKAGRVVTCYVVEGNLAQADEAKRKQTIEEYKTKMRVARRLGAPVVRLNLGNTGKENADDTLGIDRVVAAFKELVPVARQLHLKIGIENHGGPSRNGSNIVRIIQATDPKVVGAVVDFGNFSPDRRYEEITAVAPYALSTHVKINEFESNGEAASYDFPRVVQIFKRFKYKGPLSIEYEGKGDPVEGVQKTKALIVKYW